MDPSTRPGAWERICEFKQMMRTMLVLDIIFFVLALFAFVINEPGTSSYVMVQIDLFLMGTLFVALVIPLYKCERR